VKLEKWNVIAYNRKYEVSDYGRVRNRKTGRILKPQISPTCKEGYLMVSLSNGFKNRKTYVIHRLVVRAFYGVRPRGKECCHNDGNSRNNKLSNLRYDTHKANGLDSKKHGSLPRGILHRDSKLNPSKVRYIRRKYVPYEYSYAKLAKELNVSESAIRQVISGRSWGHVRR